MLCETLIVEKNNGICTITLNRPERLNTINPAMIRDMLAVFDEIAEDDTIKSVILTGAGRAFCAGADLTEMTKPENRRKNPSGFTFFDRLEECPKPVIAAINGHCNGGGFEIALCCDFRITAPSAMFGLGEVKLGTIPLGGGTARLPRLIGPSMAKEFLYFGDRVNGNEAYRMGIANKVVSEEDLLKEASAWCSRLENSAPLSIKAMKRLVNQGMQMDIRSALEFEKKCGEILATTKDQKEGIAAFLEKRKPVFTGN